MARLDDTNPANMAHVRDGGEGRGRDGKGDEGSVKQGKEMWTPSHENQATPLVTFTLHKSFMISNINVISRCKIMLIRR